MDYLTFIVPYDQWDRWLISQNKFVLVSINRLQFRRKTILISFHDQGKQFREMRSVNEYGQN